jgi:acetyltransferase-like isoleucine patch superfamily enzyme
VGVRILTSTHATDDPTRRAGRGIWTPTTIGDGVFIGSSATILPGLTIGSGSVIAAGAVVTENVPPNTLVGGIPARVIRDLSTAATR